MRSLPCVLWDWGSGTGKTRFQSVDFLVPSVLCKFAMGAKNRSCLIKDGRSFMDKPKCGLEKEGEIEFAIGDDLNEEFGASLKALGGAGLSWFQFL